MEIKHSIERLDAFLNLSRFISWEKKEFEDICRISNMVRILVMKFKIVRYMSIKIELTSEFFYKDGVGYKVDFKIQEADEFPFEFDIVVIEWFKQK